MLLQKPMLGTQIDRSNSLNNPVLDLLMNEGHGDRVNDLSGHGNHGTLHGFDFPPSRTSGWNPGADGVALAFSAAGSNYVHTTRAISEISKNHAHSIVMRVYIASDEIEHGRTLVANTNSVNDRISIMYRDGSLRAGIYNGTTAIRCSGAMSLRAWHKIIYTFDLNTVKLYIDGIQQTGNEAPTMTEDVGFVVGAATDGKSKFLDGLTNSVYALPRAMSAFEVMQTQIDPYGVYLQ